MKKSPKSKPSKIQLDSQDADAPMTYDPVTDLGLKTGTPQCATTRDLYAEYCMRLCGLSYGVAVGFDLLLRRPIDARSNPSRTGCEIDEEHANRLCAKILNHEQLPMVVAYRKPGDSLFDFAGGNHRVVGYVKAGIRYVNVYIIKYDPLRKDAIEDILPWRLNGDNGKAISQEMYITKALSLLKQGSHTEKEVCEMFSLKPDMLHMRREHRTVVDGLKDSGIHVPKDYAESKTLLADLCKIETEVVRNEAAKVAMAAGYKATQIRDLALDVNKITKSEAAKLAYLRELSVELGIAPGMRIVSAAETKAKRIAVTGTSKAMRTWLKCTAPTLRLFRKLQSVKDTRVTDPKELTEIRLHCREINNRTLVLLAR